MARGSVLVTTTLGLSENFSGAVVHQLRAHARPEALGVVHGRALAASHHAAPIERDHASYQFQDSLVCLSAGARRGERPHGRLAAAAQRFDDRALSVEGGSRGNVAYPRHEVADGATVAADFDRNDALPGRRHTDLGGQRHRDPVLVAEASKTGSRQDEGTVAPVVQLPQPSVEITANRLEARIGKQPGQLRDPAHAPGADRGRLTENRHQIHHSFARHERWLMGIDTRGQHHRVEWIFAGQDAGDLEAGGQHGR